MGQQSPNDGLIIHLHQAAIPSPALKSEPKQAPTACSASQIVPEHPRKRHGVLHQREIARMNVLTDNLILYLKVVSIRSKLISVIMSVSSNLVGGGCLKATSSTTRGLG